MTTAPSNIDSQSRFNRQPWVSNNPISLPCWDDAHVFYRIKLLERIHLINFQIRGTTMRKVAFLVMLIGLALSLAACSSGTKTPAAEDVTVTVGQPTEFKIESATTSFKVGVKYHVTVVNKGSVAHEIMLMPVVEPGSMTMSQMDKMALGMVEQEDLGPGKTKSFDVTFSDADVGKKLELACHLAGHYEGGMHTPIQVTK
jgi:uncharacterized cupredoxin-like copper-binding protein